MTARSRRPTAGVVARATGLSVLALAVAVGFADLKGWLGYSDRRAFVEWAIQSDAPLPAGSAAGRAFMTRFPPSLADRRLVTHVTTWKTSFADGPVLDASFNYMRRDESRTDYVATLPQVREWAAESRYGWLPWALTVIGFIPLLGEAVFAA
ncbi:MAG: hypothetical protein A3F70_01360 [Acidobacteria bacterium RIFCSPLOWO2_12_FULL_67_14]|nr:MAG: hypothetical protein A3H29_12495 [Acidobacteria bacterium RIFCSPLOWO2_02_FULL_67_21]OFW38443.1 MAG: hypothetical protein A3F70_01360 [Acidobacteria bacterium RIFCSPLOWO2_12_FULL_67_14]